MGGLRSDIFRGPETPKWSRRFGKEGLPSPGGMNTEVMPADIPPHQFLELGNARWEGNDIKPRGGMTVAGPLRQIASQNSKLFGHEAYQGRPLRVYVVGGDCPGLDAVGSYIGSWDDAQNPPTQRAGHYRSVAFALNVASWNRVAYLGVDSQLRKLWTFSAPWGTEAITIAGQDTDQILDDYDPFWIQLLIPFDLFLFAFLQHKTLAQYKVVTYDLVASRTDLDPLSSPCRTACVVNDKLVAFLTDGSTKWRKLGASPGTWTTGGGVTISPQPRNGLNASVQFKGRIYVVAKGTAAAAAGDSNVIWEWDPATNNVAVARTITTASHVVETLAAIAGKHLFYPHYHSTTSQAYLGMYDGTTWNDTWIDLTAAGFGASRPYGAAYHRNRLVVFGYPNDATKGQYLFSRGFPTSSVGWYSQRSSLGGWNCHYLLVQ